MAGSSSKYTKDRCSFSRFASPIIDTTLYPDLHHTWSGRALHAARLPADPPFLCWLWAFTRSSARALEQCQKQRLVILKAQTGGLNG